MVVMRPPWTTARSHATVVIQVRHERADLDACRRADDAGSMRGPATATIRSPGMRAAAIG